MVIQVMVVGWSGVMLPSIFGVVIIHHNPVHYCNWVNLSNVATCFKMISPMTGFPPWHCAELFAWPGLFTTHAALARSSVILWTPSLAKSFLSRPNLTKLLAMWFAQEQPEFPYTTVQLLCICLTASTFVLNFVTSASLNAWINAKRIGSWTCEAIEQRLCHEDARGSGPGSGRNQQALAGLVYGLDVSTRTATTMDPPSSSGRSHRGFGEKTHMFDG